MSPEQARGETVDARSDIYSLGCILFELLTGQVPFAAKNPLAILARLAMEDAVPPSARAVRFGVPPALDAVVLRALAKDRDKRYAEVEELDAALGALDLSSLPEPSPQAPAKSDFDDGATTQAQGEAATIPRSPAALHALPTPAPTPQPPPSEPRTAVIAPPRPDPLSSAALTESTRSLHEAPRPLIDPATERRVIRVVIPVVLGLVLLGLALLYAPGSGALDRGVLRSWMPAFAAAAFGLCGLLLVIARTQQSSRSRKIANRSLTVLSVALVTTSIYLKGAVTAYDILYYPVLVILDRLRENRSLAVFTFVSSVIGFSTVVLLSTFDLAPYAPLYPRQVSPELVHDLPHALLVLLVMGGITFLSFLLVDVLATRVQRREAELRQIGLGLAGRVEEQVQLLKRSADLRRYLPPALADAILRGEADGTRSHQRRRITVVRIDCPAIANAVDETDPEEFAHLLNQLYALLGDRAVEHGGLVDRFGHGGATVLFGAMESSPPEEQSRAAVAFARASVDAIAALALACKAAGVVEAPAGRGAAHQGFATVGSFGSPTRLEFTAVGPVADATTLLLDRVTAGQVLVTQAIELSLGGAVALTPLPEPVMLPGTRHPLRLYTLGM
jgi:class 3 adenylate cyclase